MGPCKYSLINYSAGKLLVELFLLQLGANYFRLSLADSDILLWAQAIRYNWELVVIIRAPDIVSATNTGT